MQNWLPTMRISEDFQVSISETRCVWHLVKKESPPCFGDCGHMDHMIMKNLSTAASSAKNGLIILDEGTTFMNIYFQDILAIQIPLLMQCTCSKVLIRSCLGGGLIMRRSSSQQQSAFEVSDHSDITCPFPIGRSRTG